VPSLIIIIEAVAALLWVYTGLTLLAWINHTRRLSQGAHVPAVVELLGHLVPAMIALVTVVLAGALIGLPSVVAFIAILFPAGTAYGTHMALSEAQDPPVSPRKRLVGTMAIAAAIILYRSAT
jgi:hypothetical protein